MYAVPSWSEVPVSWWWLALSGLSGLSWVVPGDKVTGIATGVLEVGTDRFLTDHMLPTAELQDDAVRRMTIGCNVFLTVVPESAELDSVVLRSGMFQMDVLWEVGMREGVTMRTSGVVMRISGVRTAGFPDTELGVARYPRDGFPAGKSRPGTFRCDLLYSVMFRSGALRSDDSQKAACEDARTPDSGVVEMRTRSLPPAPMVSLS